MWKSSLSFEQVALNGLACGCSALAGRVFMIRPAVEIAQELNKSVGELTEEDVAMFASCRRCHTGQGRQKGSSALWAIDFAREDERKAAARVRPQAPGDVALTEAFIRLFDNSDNSGGAGLRTGKTARKRENGALERRRRNKAERAEENRNWAKRSGNGKKN